MTVEVDLTQQIISINDTRTEIVVQAPGPAGAQGPTGPAGATGPAGTAGPAGSAATIAVGSVTQGTAVAVTNSGSSSAAVFNFVLVKGDKGDTGNTGATGSTGAAGSAATIAVGSVRSDWRYRRNRRCWLCSHDCSWHCHARDCGGRH
jgi:hypothetical protein